MAGYRPSKLGCNLFRNFDFGSNKFRTCVQRKPIIFESSSGFSDESKQTPSYTCMPNLVGERRYHIALSPKHLATNCGEFRQISDHWRQGFYHPNSLISNEQRRYYHSNINVMVPSLVAALSTLGVARVAYLSLLEEIPFSKRKILALVPRRVERLIADREIEKDVINWKVLPASHPLSLRVNLVTEKMIEALRRGLRDKKNWGGPSYALRLMEAFKALWEGKEWIDTNEQIRQERHIDRYIEVVNSWRVIIVDDPDTINSFANTNGTIVTHTGYLEIVESDAELAVNIGHEVAHCVARHFAEAFTFSSSLLGIIGYIWNGFDIPSLEDKLQILLKDPSLSIRQELEADYIGMMLMASAGYDPRVALTANKKLDKRIREQREEYEDPEDVVLEEEEGGDKYRYYPTEEERAQNLTQALKEAMSFYKESTTKYSNVDS